MFLGAPHDVFSCGDFGTDEGDLKIKCDAKFAGGCPNLELLGWGL
jgi:hypothetical protein